MEKNRHDSFENQNLKLLLPLYDRFNSCIHSENNLTYRKMGKTDILIFNSFRNGLISRINQRNKITKKNLPLYKIIKKQEIIDPQLFFKFT